FEFEVEHGGTGSGSEDRGEAELEQVYIDFRKWDALGYRAGLVLMPMGIINETHEPPTFHGVRRPSVETNIIPSTWMEFGAGFLGKLGPLSYETYAVNGLQAVGNGRVRGFSGSTGLREGRAEGSFARAADAAWIERLDVRPVEGTLIG